MNSKRALEEWYGTISVNDKIRWENNYLSIKKDLEILEIIKRHCDFSSPLSMDYFIEFFVYNSDEDFEKVKEWLEE